MRPELNWPSELPLTSSELSDPPKLAAVEVDMF